MRFALSLAVAYGLLLPAAETWRRWDQLTSGNVFWPGFLDDWLLGLVLLAAAWTWRRNRVLGRRCLIAAWALVCGMGYASFFLNLRDIGQADPSGVRHGVVVAAIAGGLALAIAALVTSIFARDPEQA